MKLLFITQKIDEQDDDLAFVTQWIDEFIKSGFEVEVLCLEKGKFDGRFTVQSLGKEKGSGKVKRIFSFYKYIFSHNCDRVFIHMNPEYFTLGGWYWFASRTPMYLWYTHYTTHIHLKLASLFSKRMFAATKQSLPQYDSSDKKIVTGHGVNVGYWYQKNICLDPTKMLMVHRLSRSKRVELGIESLRFLPEEYTLTIYGRPVDEEYYKELNALVKEHNLENRVVFKGPVPMPELRSLYLKHRIMINMASETIDKTMLEAMCNGVFPVTTSGNMEAIGLDFKLKEDSAKTIADFVLSGQALKLKQEELLKVVKEKHSLTSLVSKMSTYIESGV
ncbi:glycosyltransferase family 4 protein [Candidatus Nomurabacteria bacterium]|nr:glycosyltransferase family 4 protein [Candidatus Nomurabacteria bacterium]